ncbi:dsDNA nuclease domain-containing protein [Klebsiella variicola]|uniref:dsDNA nuclease domain-containing protein n=1 Tax=Klebsiella variicola TaxID=244366 RepID=UPI001CF1256E|nr:dsDNA nuclease domain-containing protein [Klebsiella variicola]MCB3487939.1 DUF4297 domain-containing protein [Klebsiella variicola]MCD9769688.1 dsDNA nuclease domain-containing protein [Klebsiella variicola subsp. variicola]MCD9917749.1 dsDNA nuclease domain-containing protein [Klebsiella variicola subsp. variicola]HBX9982429.1 DUF4297 domain-containing protein [Klebsiella variicola]HBZ6193780.1 DUF4297 domain-containing protein [Klebsiella variicola]
MTTTLRDPSDSGAIASRAGYNYQDYIAVSLVLDMLYNDNIKAVRCEHIDDIEVVHNDFIEYVQVKSTEGESYWSLTELKTKDGLKTIIQKSLDSDKENGVISKFRVISKRGVRKEIKHLLIVRENRSKTKERDALLKSLLNVRHHKGYKSSNGNDIEYWVDNCHWQIIPTSQEVIYSAQKKLHLFANKLNLAVFDSEIEELYFKILHEVKSIADASNRSSTIADKTFTQTKFRDLMKGWCVNLTLDRNSSKKVYGQTKNIIFSPLNQHISQDGKRSCQGYYLEYARQKFRYEKIVNNILEWMPEFILTPKELAENDSVDCFPLWRKTIERAKSYTDTIDINYFIIEILLHILLRYKLQSQPIYGMLYINAKDKVKEFNNVHVVNNTQTGNDELWLGRAFISYNDELNNTLDEFSSFLFEVLDPDIFDHSKKKIFEAKNDSHIITHNINDVLNEASTISNNIDRYKIVTLFVYNSDTLKSGYSKEYQEKLLKESADIFNMYCKKLISLQDDEINQINISALLIPLEKFEELRKTFLGAINNGL